jgi:hypothetical protein
LEQLLARLAPFRIPNGAELNYAAGQTRGLASLPLEFFGVTAPSGTP